MVKESAFLKDSSFAKMRYMRAMKQSVRDSTTSTNMICRAGQVAGGRAEAGQRLGGMERQGGDRACVCGRRTGDRERHFRPQQQTGQPISAFVHIQSIHVPARPHAL
jgi:hypothetical protein